MVHRFIVTSKVYTRYHRSRWNRFMQASKRTKWEYFSHHSIASVIVMYVYTLRQRWLKHWVHHSRTWPLIQEQSTWMDPVRHSQTSEESGAHQSLIELIDLCFRAATANSTNCFNWLAYKQTTGDSFFTMDATLTVAFENCGSTNMSVFSDSSPNKIRYQTYSNYSRISGPLLYWCIVRDIRLTWPSSGYSSFESGNVQRLYYRT